MDYTMVYLIIVGSLTYLWLMLNNNVYFWVTTVSNEFAYTNCILLFWKNWNGPDLKIIFLTSQPVCGTRNMHTIFLFIVWKNCNANPSVVDGFLGYVHFRLNQIPIN